MCRSLAGRSVRREKRTGRRGLLTEAGLDEVNQRLLRGLADAGVTVDAIYTCPHHPAAVDPGNRSCGCRKPLPGLVLAAARQLDLDLARSVFLGDQDSDRRAAEAAGIPADRFFLVDGAMVPEGVAAEVTDALRRAVSGP